VVQLFTAEGLVPTLRYKPVAPKCSHGLAWIYGPPSLGDQ
jgi:hypothetical protein